ncbi:right-handed parallel beta-helix repeat-containing protein [Planctomycetota bacterium]
MRVDNCHFIGSGDKGISVGENSQLLVLNCAFVKCDLGMEIKDASIAVVRDSLFQKNRLALHSYQKKWLYRKGGSTLLIDCRILDSREADVSMEKRSTILLMNTTVSKISQAKKRIQQIENIDEFWQNVIKSLE